MRARLAGCACARPLSFTVRGRLLMQYHPLRVVVLMAALLTACASDTVRIDGTSPASFAESHRRLMRSLSPADQTRLLLAETLIRAAATPNPTAQAPGALPEIVPLEAVRAQLNGKTLDEILQLSKSLDIKVKVGFITQPAL